MQCPKCKFEFVVRKRTNPMNSYLWGVVYKMLSDELGYSSDDLHELMKLKFNSKTILVGKDEIKIGLSTASLTVSEFNAYVSRIVMFASFELGIIIPEPDPEEHNG